MLNIRKPKYIPEENKKKTELISKVIISQGFDVPDWFVDVFVDEYVVKKLLYKIPLNGYPYSSTNMMELEFGDFLDPFISFMKKMIYDKKFIKFSMLKDIPSALAIYLLSEKDWERYLKHKKSDNIDLWEEFVIEECAINGIMVPKALMMRRLKYNTSLRTYVNKLTDVRTAKKIVETMDYYDLLEKNLYVLVKYWELGGTYFPEDICSKYLDQLDASGCIKIYEDNAKKNHTSRAGGYFIYKLYGKDTNTIYDLSSDGILAHLDEFLDELLYIDGYFDVNIFKIILNLVSGDEKLMDYVIDYLRGREKLRQFEKLILEDSKEPLYNFNVYHTLTKRIGTADFSEQFIKRGGHPYTIMQSGISDYNNICYTLKGVRAILDNSTTDDIVLLMSLDESFINYVREISNAPNVSGLTLMQVIRLIDAASRISDKRIIDKLGRTTILGLMKKMGEKNILAAVPQSIQWIVSDPYQKMDYAYIMDLVKSNHQIIQYIPIQYIFGDWLMGYLHFKEETNAVSTFVKSIFSQPKPVSIFEGCKKINTDSIKLNHVCGYDKLNELIIDHPGYLINLTPLSAIEFVDKLTK